MFNLSFSQEEMRQLRALLDIPPGKEPTAQLVLETLERGSQAGMELSLLSGRKNPLLLDARRRQLAAVKGGL